MKIISLLFFLTALFFYKSYAQSHLPSVYEIQSDTAMWTAFSYQYWQILEDKEGKLTLDEVSNSTVSNRFHDSLSQIDQSVNVYWLRYTLKNTMERPAHISIDGNWEFADTYMRKSNGGWVHFRSGTHRNWDERSGLKYANLFPDTLNPQEEILVYQRLQSKEKGIPPNFGIGFDGTSPSIKSLYVDYVEERNNHYNSINLQEAFLIGLLLLAMFINLYFYGIMKEKAHLYFFLFALFLSINRLYNILSSFTFWHKPEWQDYVEWLIYAWAFIPLFLIQFFRHFLNINKYFPKWGKLLLGLGILNFLMVLVRPFLPKVTISLVSTYFNVMHYFIIPFSIIITLLLFIKEKSQAVRLLTIGAMPFFLLYIGSYIFMSITRVLLPNFRLIEVVALTWLVIFFTITLLMRFDQLRKQNSEKQLENERLAKEIEIERNELIAIQKIQLEKEVFERTAELKQSLEDLKSTQNQLIQKEKLASLGELTAGIAHEIQNPLNFVNNFSELSVDLVKDLKDEIDKPTIDTEYIGELFDDLSSNQEKINHHGKRASSIVKGMLEHSRASTGEMELTDINALADEYLRLSYHGLRAKDKDFNADFTTDFDENLPKIEVIPQDIGRVLLNLFNNAFYAVQERNLRGFQNLEGLNTYIPSVLVTTQQFDNQIIIKVKDNGGGMPESVRAKVFQPFFTTKPTGQGTGLGLSLAYDIVTKGHGGTLEVISKEGEGTEFIMQLPSRGLVQA